MSEGGACREVGSVTVRIGGVVYKQKLENPTYRVEKYISAYYNILRLPIPKMGSAP